MRTSIRLFAGLLLLALPAAAQDKPEPTQKPFLWMIEGETPSFLYGTVHVPDERITTLPPVVIEAIDACDALLCELKMDMASQMAAAGKMMIPGGKSLKDVIPADLYQRLEAHMKKKGLPLAPPFTQMKPAVVAGQVQMLDFMKDMMRGKKALDQLLYEKAQKAGKKVDGLETAEEQIAAFDALDGVEMLRQTLDQEEKAAGEGKKAMEQLLELYLAGDLEKIEAMYAQQMAEAPPEFREVFERELVVGRNKKMAERISARLKEEPGTSYFFAVGTLHYPGEEGLLKLLEAAGHKLRRLSAEDAGTLSREPAGAGAPR